MKYGYTTPHLQAASTEEMINTVGKIHFLHRTRLYNSSRGFFSLEEAGGGELDL